MKIIWVIEKISNGMFVIGSWMAIAGIVTWVIVQWMK